MKEYTSKMQVRPSAAIRAAIANLQIELQIKGYPPRGRSFTALFVRCVEAGIERLHNNANIFPVTPENYGPGQKLINIPFTYETRKEIKLIARRHHRQRDMVNILALWGLESIMQHVHALPYVEIRKPKMGRPRTKNRDLVS